jgi:hypothetical protein
MVGFHSFGRAQSTGENDHGAETLHDVAWEPQSASLDMTRSRCSCFSEGLFCPALQVRDSPVWEKCAQKWS